MNAADWRELELVGVAASKDFRVRSTGLEVKAGHVSYAVDSEDRYHLLVPVSSTTRLQPDRRSAGVHLEPRTLEDEAGSRTYIDVVCRKDHLKHIFVRLAAEIVAEIASDADHPEAACRRTVSRWREFLDRDADTALSREALLGLFGELWVLRQLMSLSPSAHHSWRGPAGEPHDFRSGPTALEVKTTRLQGKRLRINGIDQLEAPQGGTLHLQVVVVDDSDPSGETVPAIVDDVLALGAEASILMTKLAKAGYHARHITEYRQVHVKLASTVTYAVRGSFPRLTRSSLTGGVLPTGVEGIQYTMVLPESSEHLLGGGEIASLYAALAEALA